MCVCVCVCDAGALARSRSGAHSAKASAGEGWQNMCSMCGGTAKNDTICSGHSETSLFVLYILYMCVCSGQLCVSGILMTAEM